MGRFKTPLEIRRESRRLEIAGLLMQGITGWERIAKEVGCGVVTVCTDIKAIRAAWRLEMVALFDAAKEEQLKRIDKVEENAWCSFNNSRKSVATRVRLRLNSDQPELVNALPGDPRFLELVRRCSEDRRKLLGLDEPEQIDIKGQVAVASIHLQQLIESNGEYIEYRRQQVLGQPAVAGLLGYGNEPGQVAAGTPPVAAGYVVGKDGNGQAVAATATVVRPRSRLT